MESSDKGYYYSENLQAFHRWYGAIHGYLTLTICLFGLVGNIANIIIFKKRHMISPTHAILTVLAAADMLLMLSYTIFTFNTHIRGGWQKSEPLSYGRAVFDIFNMIVRALALTVSNWTTVAAAVFRVVAVRCPAGATTWCSMSRAKCAIRATCIGAALCCIPFYITYTVTPTHEEGLYRLGYSHIAQLNEYLLLRLITWSQVVRWLMPCVALAVCCCLLIGYRLQQRNAWDHTTRMLLGVFLMTLVTQTPFVLVRLLTSILGQDFRVNVEYTLTNVLEAVILFNKAVTFAIYCLISRQFRYTMVVNAVQSEPNSESCAMTANTFV